MFNMLGALRILLLSRFMDLMALSLLFFAAALQVGPSAYYSEAAVFMSALLFFISLIAIIPAS
jgi:hypothetical protein